MRKPNTGGRQSMMGQFLRCMVSSAYRLTIASTLQLVLLWSAGASEATAQQRYTLALRGVALDEALEQFVDATDRAVVYDPTLVRGHRAYCAVEKAAAEAVLRCLLRESGLDFYRLSSGTYVLTPPAELPPQPGYLAGLVTDRDTDAPLAYAHVYVQEADVGTVTNRSGRFVLPPLLPGRYTVRISHLGYHAWQDTLRVTPQEQTHTQATLQAEPILITPVVVDGHQQGLAAEALGQDRLDARGASAGQTAVPVMYKRLNALPGVRINDVTADAHVQGSDAGAHQLRLDGVPVYLPRTLAGLVGPFSAFALDRITVQKAGFGASEGSQIAGLLLAEHAVEATDGADVQVDPLSFNARVQLSSSASSRPATAFMAAARVGLWDLFAPSRLQQTLAAWSAPDDFLFTAPPDSVTGILMSSDISTSSDTRPSIRFSDLHAAARLRLSPLRTLYVSAYRGYNQLTGGVLSDRGHQPQRADTATPFTVDDDYDWHNSLGQIRYDAVMGSHTLLSAQLRGSRYALQHDYRILDSLLLVSDRQVAHLSDIATVPIRDGNDVRTAALEGSVDHARNRHHLRAGAEVAYTESTFDLYGVRFPLPVEGPETIEESPDYGAVDDVFLASRQPAVRHDAAGWRLATFASDRLNVTDRLQAELGVRLTYFPDRATVYAEPRLAVHYDHAEGRFGPWSARVAAGLYRQFTQQTDASVLNAGALLPSVRIWLPLDRSVRPPKAYHLTPELLVQLAARWRLRLEGYVKYQPHRLTLRYAPVTEERAADRLRQQAHFLASAQERSYGGTASLIWRHEQATVHARYEYSHATQRSAALFEGRTETVPWNQPHRVELGLDWTPTSHLTVSTRGHGVWGRTWGFRRVYYDYFGHHPETRTVDGVDLGHPSAHVLPAFYRLDLSLTYARPLGPASLQVRLDVLNVTDRKNVADWRLVLDEDTWHKEPRYQYPRLPSVAVRLSF